MNPARVLAAMLGTLLLAVTGQVVSAAPAYAHAELVDSSPANGERLQAAPREVVLRFTERVSPVQEAFRLLDAATGDRLPAAAGFEEPADGSTLRYPLPDLPDGSYLVTWRVVSADSHPVAGSFSFGIGQDAPPVTTSSATVTSAPWPVTAARGIGYLAFAMVAGALALALLCWRQGRNDGRLRRLRTVGIVVGVAATVLGLLLGYLVEINMRRALILSNEGWAIFIQRPIALTFIILSVLTLFYPVVLKWRAQRRATAERHEARV